MSDNKSFKVQNGLDVTGDANISGSVTATSFIGDGSQLTGISGGSGGGLDSASVQSLIDAEVDATTLVLGTGTTAGIRIGKSASANTLSGGGIAIGQNANANGTQGIAIGIGAEGDNNAIGIGINAETANSSVSIGRSAVSRSQGTAMGMSSTAMGTATAVGYNAKAGNTTFGTGSYSVAIGANANAQYNYSVHINGYTNAGTGPDANGGIVIESSVGRLEYSTADDWVFNAPVTLPGATISGHIIPDTNAAYDLGSAEKKFRHLYLSNNSLYAESGRLSFEGGQLTFRDDPVLMLSEVQAIAAASDTFEDFKAALASL